MQTEQHEIEALLGSRARTDHRISERLLIGTILTNLQLVFNPLILLNGAFSQFSFEIIDATLIVLVTVGFFSSALSAYFVYLIVNRRNNHLAREQAMFGDVLQLLRAKVQPT